MKEELVKVVKVEVLTERETERREEKSPYLFSVYTRRTAEPVEKKRTTLITIRLSIYVSI